MICGDDGYSGIRRPHLTKLSEANRSNLINVFPPIGRGSLSEMSVTAHPLHQIPEQVSAKPLANQAAILRLRQPALGARAGSITN